MKSEYEYRVIEDNGGGLTLYVFGNGGIDGGAVIYAHASYEYTDGQLMTDLDALDAGADVTEWDGNEEDPQSMYDDLEEFEHGWDVVAQGADGKRTLYTKRMGVSAKREFKIVAD